MSQTTSKRVIFRPDIAEKLKLSLKPDTNARAAEGRQKEGGRCIFRQGKGTESSMVKLLRRFRARMTRSICFVSVRRVSPKTCPSSKQFRHSVSPHDSHRSEDIADCIEFINSSSSLGRSN